jgi:aminoglycoside/choline kinase family phosphotransferase
MSRDLAIREFLAAEGWAGALRSPLAGDASARRYERLTRAGRTALLMDMPPASGLTPGPYLAVNAWLRAGGFSAPEVYAAAPERGLVLIEDFGDALFSQLCAEAPEREPELYGAAVDLLAALQARDPGADGWTPPPYDRAVLMRELRLAVEWYLPVAAGRPIEAGLAAEYEALADAAMARVPALGPVAVYRDFHAENLIWLPERRGHARVGLLDFQDMLVGSPAYDLVSLLEDARRDTGAELRAAMLARYLGTTGADAAAFGHAAAALSAQRNLKILGLFTRLCRRDGTPRYVALLPRVWGHLMDDLRHPALAPLAGWVAAYLPPPDARVRAAIVGVAA